MSRATKQNRPDPRQRVKWTAKEDQIIFYIFAICPRLEIDQGFKLLSNRDPFEAKRRFNEIMSSAKLQKRIIQESPKSIILKTNVPFAESENYVVSKFAAENSNGTRSLTKYPYLFNPVRSTQVLSNAITRSRNNMNNKEIYLKKFLDYVTKMIQMKFTPVMNSMLVPCPHSDRKDSDDENSKNNNNKSDNKNANANNDNNSNNTYINNTYINNNINNTGIIANKGFTNNSNTSNDSTTSGINLTNDNNNSINTNANSIINTNIGSNSTSDNNANNNIPPHGDLVRRPRTAAGQRVSHAPADIMIQNNSVITLQNNTNNADTIAAPPALPSRSPAVVADNEDELRERDSAPLRNKRTRQSSQRAEERRQQEKRANRDRTIVHRKKQIQNKCFQDFESFILSKFDKSDLAAFFGYLDIHKVTKTRMTLGRSSIKVRSDLDLAIYNMQSVARQHAEIALCMDSKFYLRVLGRDVIINGSVFYQNQHIQLKDHDIIDLGGVPLMFFENPAFRKQLNEAY